MKIFITGLGCSGKSTLAREIGKITGLPVYHLDRYLWNRNWIKATEEEFTVKQAEILDLQSWVYEGFNRNRLAEQIAAADQIIYIKKSHVVLSLQWVKRLWKYRKHSRPDITEGNIEKFNFAYLKWLWKYDNKDIIADIYRLSGDKKVTIISTKKEYRAYLAELI